MEKKKEKGVGERVREWEGSIEEKAEEKKKSRRSGNW